MKNILIVDNDLDFIYWLGALLIRSDYQPLPACNAWDAVSVVRPKPALPLDLMIVNPSLPGISHLITLYRRSQADLKVIALGSRDEKALPDVRIWREKPDPADESAKRQWVRALQSISIGHKYAA